MLANIVCINKYCLLFMGVVDKLSLGFDFEGSKL